MYFRILYTSLFFFILNLNIAFTQSKVLTQIPGLPSTEVYDLLTDSKGFLWIANSDGISKYDGINFISFTNPQQSSLSVTGLIEDKYGRIWFNNFTGQIFYIENGRMKLLKEYDGKNEPSFPRIGLYKDRLVASTKRGLFICDINTLKCHYENCKDPLSKGTTSLCVLSNKVIAFGYKYWYTYEPGKGLRLTGFNKNDTKLIKQNIGTLNAKAFKDTAFLFCNPKRILYKLVSINDSLKVCKMQQLDYYINTINVQNNGYWINTVRYSISMPGNNVVKGYNISCLTNDKQGHTWYGSLQKGLITNLENENPLKNKCIIPLLKDDIIQSLIKYDSLLLLGTQNGNLISYNTRNGRSKLLISLPRKNNGISYLKNMGNDEILIGSPTKTFIFNIPDKSIRQNFSLMSIKQADTINQSLVVATSPGLVFYPLDKDGHGYGKWKRDFSQNFTGLSDIDGDSFKFLGVEQRTKAVCCFSNLHTIWAAFKNGLYKINKAGIKPYYYNGSSVYASSLTTYGNSLIAGTFSNGILIIDGSKIKHINTDDGLLSNNILQLKVINNNLWIYNSGLVQVFDLQTLKIVNYYQLPGVSDEIVNDIDEVNGQPYLANVNGLYKIPIKNIDTQAESIYLNSLLINGKDTSIVNNITLPYYQNDIQINLGVPTLINGRNTIIKYRLLINQNAKWTYSKPGERNFRFESLMPGRYLFEAIAGRPQTGVTGRMIKISIIIKSAWWKRWWAIGCLVIIGASIIFGISRLYYIGILSTEKAEYEKKLAIELERQRISSDMHDDIGASLAAIRLYTESVKQSDDPSSGISSIYGMMSDLSNKIREVIWSLNKVYDTLENLIYYIDANANKLFQHSKINFKVILPDVIPDVKIASDKRRDVFLIIKEGLHNIIKHAEASEASVQLKIEDNYLDIVIKDNGKGIMAPLPHIMSGQGLTNIKKRVKDLGGKITIENTKGTSIKLKIPV